MQNEKIIIVGGGINGLCAAYYLQKKSYNVTIIDSGDITDNCSFGNMGFLSPSHFIPLASPGVVAEGLKHMLSRTSPFYIKPRLNMTFIEWAIKFYKNSTQKIVEKNAPHLSALLNLSRRLMNEIRDDIGDVFEMEEKGCMMMCRQQKTFEEELKLADAAERFGLKVERLNKYELQSREPDVELDIYGAILFKDDAHIHPGKFMLAMKKYLEQNGVNFQFNTTVTGFKKNQKTIESVITDKGIFSGNEILLSPGSWLPQLAKMLGIKLLIEGGKGYSYTYDHIEKNIRYPAILVDGRCAVTPWKQQLRIGGTMEFSGNNNKVLINRMQGIYDSVKLFYPGLKINFPSKDKIWTGLRPVSPDGLPYIGKVDNFENLLIAGGHAMLGISEGAATGKIISDIVDKKSTPIDISAFKVGRF
ncbi:MAG: FAD-dependent oxidoreductase [Bacteroidota bacterium]|nr:FAD-dependent oxidoreductase [Bacteroidota bacterium]